MTFEWYKCRYCGKVMIFEPADDHSPAGFVYDCKCMDVHAEQAMDVHTEARLNDIHTDDSTNETEGDSSTVSGGAVDG